MTKPPRYVAHRSFIGVADGSEAQLRPGQIPTSGAAELRPVTATGNGRQPRPNGRARPHIAGKFLARGAEELYLGGVTYGPFQPGPDGVVYSRSAVRKDFSAMAAAGINSLRLYTVPPRWLLDCASEHGLAVLVGLPGEQNDAFLDDRSRRRSITAGVREGVRACAGHPAVLGYAVGNEIPASIVRWHGRRKVERFIRRLYEAAKSEDPDGLITYVNFPSTEYLELPFLDFVCFNVYLEQRDRLEAYLYRLQTLAGDRPLVLAELGLDSRRNGERRQAESLSWQIRAAFAGGCAGLFAFAWTDEWWHGGEAIEDWDFGLTTRAREPKPALAAVSDAYDKAPLAPVDHRPRVSVIVCTYNGAATLEDCLDGLAKLEYPEYEVIVVDDGSTDSSPQLAARHDVRLIRTANRGLGSARNTGMRAAGGEIVAYIDDDARPDPHWLDYLVEEFARSDHCAVGGPNIAPGGEGVMADCVANSPGGPIHVLLSDSEAEHIPGCNMAIRADALRAIGGFDPQFTAAGDDVDVCWRLTQRGWTIGFAPAAFVWHHRRNSVRAYWRQQRGYGKAEALLERKWPERYNSVGHLRWSGRMYGRGLAVPVLSGRHRVYHGTWGLAPFQSLYEPAQRTLLSLPLMPEWYLLIGALAGLSGLGALWRPLLGALPLLALCLVMMLAGATRSAARQGLPTHPRLSRRRRAALLGLTTALHLVQPVARLAGRLVHGLSPWRLRGDRSVALPVARALTAWSETWRGADQRQQAIEAALRKQGIAVRRGGDFDRWDLEVRCGTLGRARVRMVIEEHGQGKQLIRLRAWPHVPVLAIGAIGLPGAITFASALGGAVPIAAVFGGVCLLAVVRVLFECGAAAGGLAGAFHTTAQAADTGLTADSEGVAVA
jgi:O-antigen biosynthesis protein